MKNQIKYIKEDHVNKTEGYMLQEPITYPIEDTIFTGTSIKDLFNFFLKECGRCISKLYIDTDDNTKQIGWVFERKEKYTDIHEPWIHQTWITLLTDIIPEREIYYEL